MLGCAALLPLPDRALTAGVLSCGGRSILLDCGEGTQTAARRAGVSLMKTDLIALTHYHGDHIFGLSGLFQTMSVLGRQEPLTLTGPQGLERELAQIFSLAKELNFPVRLMTMPMEGLRLTDLHPAWPREAVLSCFSTDHRVASQGYCFTLGRCGKFLVQKARELEIPQALWSKLQQNIPVEVNGRAILPREVLGPARKGLKVVYSGDTRACDALLQAARDADLLVCEATYADPNRAALALERGHMTFEEAVHLGAAAGAKRLWLTHFSQTVVNPETSLADSGLLALCPQAVCARDGMAVSLGFESEAELNQPEINSKKFTLDKRMES